MGAWSTSPGSSRAIPRRFGRACGSWTHRRIQRLAGSEKKGWTPPPDGHSPRTTGQLAPIARGVHGSHDTGELCCDSIALWWEEHGTAAYPQAKRLLVLCDGGGSNSARHYLFKEDLQRLAGGLGLELRVAHYPPYCSKHNPIEHRVFPHVTRACQGVIFHTVEVAKQFIERAKTSTGLRVTVSLLDKAYATGRKYAEGFKTAMKILFDDYLPKWNYRALPQPAEIGK